MKKFIFAAVAVLMMGVSASCGGSTKDNVNDSDSVEVVDSLAVDSVAVDSIPVEDSAFCGCEDCDCGETCECK